MHSFAIADRVSKVKAFMLVVTATQPMNLTIVKCFVFILIVCQCLCGLDIVGSTASILVVQKYDFLIHQLTADDFCKVCW